MSGQVQVRFDVSIPRDSDRAPEIKGELTLDEKNRGKIVFLAGFKNNWRNWRGPLPRNEEEWVCDVVRDTQPEKTHKGALLVRLVRKAEPRSWWDCGPENMQQELFGARLPQVTRVKRVGLREVDTDRWVLRESDGIRADWPQDIREKAGTMLAEYQTARERFASLVEWPKVPDNDPANREFNVEIEGYHCSIRSSIGVTPQGLQREWSLYGPITLQGPVRTLSDQLRSEPGEAFVITRYTELRILCDLFGQPEFNSLLTFDPDYDFFTGKGRVTWGKEGISLALDPRVLFESAYNADIIDVSEYGDVTCRVTVPELGITAEVTGFCVEKEKQEAVSFSDLGKRLFNNATLNPNQKGGPLARPAVIPARPNWCAQRYLFEAQQRRLVATAAKRSLTDHRYIFRQALLESAVVRSIREKADLVRVLAKESNFRIERRPFTVGQSEPESNDGMRRAFSWTETHYYPCLIWTGGYEKLPTDVSEDIDAAIRQVVAQHRDRLAADTSHLQAALASPAGYKEVPAYDEPTDTVEPHEHEAHELRIRLLLEKLQAAVEAANSLLTRKDCQRRETQKAAEPRQQEAQNPASSSQPNEEEKKAEGMDSLLAKWGDPNQKK